MGDHCIFVRVCIEVDLRFPLKRVIVLHPENQDDEASRIRVSYEVLFEICFNCGNFTHRYEACPLRLSDSHFVMVDRLENEPAVHPAEMQNLEEVQNLISNDSLVIFPQPSYGYQGKNQFGDTQRDVNDQSDQETRSWSVVVRIRRGRGRGMYTRGNGRAIMGTRGIWSTGNEGTSANPFPASAANKNPTRIRIVNRHVNEDNIIVLSEENQNDVDNFQDANDQGNGVMAGDNNPNDDLSEGNLDDNALIEEDEDPMNFDEALEFQGPRKRTRNQFDSDDEMNNGSCSVNGPNP